MSSKRSQKFIDDDGEEEEELDGDFSDSGSDRKPSTSKKAKKAAPAKGKKVPAKKAKKADSDDEEEDSEEEVKGGLEKNKDGDKFVSLGSGNKRVTIRKYKSSVLIDIRETYEKDGVSGLPGKKGISLTAEQWSLLKENFELIDSAIDAL